MNFIPATIIRALCWTLLHSLWQGLILAIVAGTVMLMTKRAPSATRYGVLGVLVILFLTVSGYTFIRELRSPVAATTLVQKHLTPATDSPVNDPAILTHDQPAQTNFIDQLVQYFNAHASIVVVIWFIVFMARFVKLLSGLVSAQRIRHYQTGPVPAEWQERLAALVARLRISRPVQLLESALIKVPVAVGWLKPVILVPAGMLAQLSPDQVESILLHELAHISRRDYLFNLAQNVIDTLFFFNPALLWVSSLIRTERENCCDDVAIRETRSRRQLIEALVSFHEYHQTTRGYALGFAGQHNGMVKRVERIVHKRNHSLDPGERVLLMVGILVLCGAFITINGAKVEPKAATKALANINANIYTTVGAKVPANVPTTFPANAPATFSANVPATFPANAPAKAPANVIVHQPKSGVNMTRTTAALVKPSLIAKPDTAGPDTAKQTLTKADVDLLIRAHEHGVTPEYLAELKQLGYTVGMEQAIKLMDHGVSADFIRAIRKEGYSQISLDMAVRLIDHGVSAEFIHEVKAEGFPNLTLNEAVRLIDHGVTSDFIHEWKKKAGSQLELSDYVKLRDAGVDPD
ncbi:MAG TPA: M56 family metallopeptidase [Puia sp.]|nr:M56 family metallopeptidase [Puia sp.]